MCKHDCDISVIGAGISGLTTAFRLNQAGFNVKVLEASSTVGGVIQTEHRESLLLENGPFNLIVRDPAFEELLDELRDELTPVQADETNGKNRFLVKNRELIKVPGNPVGLLTTPLLSLKGKLRLIRGLIYSPHHLDNKETVDQAATRRFGTEVADTFISALVTGILAADTRLLGYEACFPNVASIDGKTSSPIAAIIKMMFKKKTHSNKPRGLISFTNGLNTLPDAIAANLGNEVLLNSTVKSINNSFVGFRIEYSDNDRDVCQLNCRQVVIATSAGVAARLVQPLDTELCNLIKSINGSSLAVVNLVYRKIDVEHPLNGYGFLIPRSERNSHVLGALWASSVFPHHAESDKHLIRIMLGDYEGKPVTNLTDKELLELSESALNKLLSTTGEPVLSDISHWPGAIPLYQPDHTDRVRKIRNLLYANEGLHLVGNYLRGVSINDCIREGARIAKHITTCDFTKNKSKRAEPVTV